MIQTPGVTTRNKFSLVQTGEKIYRAMMKAGRSGDIITPLKIGCFVKNRLSA